VLGDTTPVSISAAADWGEVSLSSLPPERQATVAQGGSASDVVSGEAASYLASTDTGALIQQAPTSTNISLYSRSPISNDPRIRGYRYGQIQSIADGAPWYPVRPDLDTPLSRIDSSLIKDVVLIKGPYSVRYGPGFAFIDVQLYETPRSECGTILGGRTAATFDENGARWYAAQTVTAAGEDYGMRVSYVDRSGDDYFSGNGTRIAADHNVHDWDTAIGFDLTSDSRIEFGYIRNDLTDVDLPSQFNDLRFMAVDGLTVKFIMEDSSMFDRLTINGWYNQTRFVGDNSEKRTGNFLGVGQNGAIIVDRTGNGNVGFPAFPGIGLGNSSSAGGRAAATWGEIGPNERQFTLGVDANHFKQNYLETYVFPLFFNQPLFDGFFFGVPDAEQTFVGMFADHTMPLTQRLTLNIGARGDLVDSHAERIDQVNPGPDPDQFFMLGGIFATASFDLTSEFAIKAGYGIGQRAPTPTELYADQPFLSILQEGGLFFAEGNNNLAAPMAQQIDLGFEGGFEDVRGQFGAFVSDIENFITWDGVRAVNNDVTLTGVEGFAEIDFLSDWFTWFATAAYVTGQNHDTAAPIWGIYPYESRTGLRFQRPTPGGSPWGLEYMMRLCAAQNAIDPTVGLIGEQATPGFTIHNLRGFWRATRWLSVLGGIHNIGDKQYIEHLDSRLDMNRGSTLGVFRPGRSLFLGAEAVY
jgi:outer membrane receptor protein involved in Fe transport